MRADVGAEEPDRLDDPAGYAWSAAGERLQPAARTERQQDRPFLPGVPVWMCAVSAGHVSRLVVRLSCAVIFEDWRNAVNGSVDAVVEGALPAGRTVVLSLDG